MSLFSHGGDNLVLLSGVSVVKHSEQILPGAVDGLAEQEVGEEKLVAVVVKLVVSILSSGMVIMITILYEIETYGSCSLESLFSCLLQFLSLEAGKLLVELLEGLLADEVPALPGHDHVEQHLGQQLHPDGEVIHASSPRDGININHILIKSKVLSHPLRSLDHMLSQFLRLTLVTATLLGLSASSQVRFSLVGLLSCCTCSNMHSRKALKINI